VTLEGLYSFVTKNIMNAQFDLIYVVYLTNMGVNLPKLGVRRHG